MLFPRMSNMFDPTMKMDPSDPMFASQINEFIQGCAGFAAGATVAVALRLFARWQKSTRMAWDDALIAVSLLPLWGMAAMGIRVAQYGGLAKHVHTLTREEEAVYYPSMFAGSVLYALAITGAKLSILLLYRRIFTTRTFRRILDVFISLCVFWCVIVIMVAIFRCTPIRTSWATHKQIHRLPHQCISLTDVYYGTSVSNLILDIIVNLLPAHQIWKLQLPKGQRILLLLCLCLGIVSIAAGIGRILTVPSLYSAELPGAIALPQNMPMPYLFIVIEPAFAIICACLPTYRPLAVWLGRKASNSTVGSKMRSMISTTVTTTTNRNSRMSLGFLTSKSNNNNGLLDTDSQQAGPEGDNSEMFNKHWSAGTTTVITSGGKKGEAKVSCDEKSSMTGSL